MMRLSSDVFEGLRITAWPGVVLPHPPVQHHSWSIQGDKLVPSRRPPDSGKGVGAREAVLEVEEIYLELINVRLSEPEQILGFANRFDLIGVREAAEAARHSAPSFAAVADRRLPPPSGPGEPLDEFVFGARYLRELTRAWSTLGRQSEPRGEWPLLRATLTIDKENHAVTPEDLERFLIAGVTAGMVPLHPRLAQVPDTPPLGVPLYSICCLELYNHIVQHATYVRCQNLSCRRRFVRQKGRAEKGQHRVEGLKYCSKQCARVQAQREYRKRAKEKQPGDNAKGNVGLKRVNGRK